MPRFLSAIGLGGFLVLTLPALPYAQTKVVIEIRQENLQVSGVLKKRAWAKSRESYCAGGSDYFVLEEGETSTVLNSAWDPLYARGTGKKSYETMFKTFSKWENRAVAIEGTLVAIEKPIDPDSTEQQADLYCTAIRVEKIGLSHVPDK